MPSIAPAVGARVEADPVADPERPCAQQHGARDQVADRLLRRESEEHRGDGTTDGERLRLEPGDAEGDEDREDDREEPDQKAERAGGAGVEALEEDRAERAADVARERPAQDHERDDARDAHRHVDPEQLHAVVVGDEDRRDERQDQDRFGAGATRAGTRVRAQLSDQSWVHAFSLPARATR